MKRQLSKISLNMLVILETLCAYKSTVIAAKELNITQPAVSQALKRLRTITGDRLFFRSSNGLEPTDHCLKLNALAKKSLDICEDILNATPKEFNPDTESKEFNISVPLQKTLYFFEKLSIKINNEHPKIKINMVTLNDNDAIRQLNAGDIDLYIGLAPKINNTSLMSKKIIDAEFRVVCSIENSIFKSGKINKKQFIECHHLKASNSTDKSFLDEYLYKEGLLQKDITLTPDKTTAIRMLKETDAIIILDEHDAEMFCKEHKRIKTLDTNFVLPAQPLYGVWNERKQQDNAHKWLRSIAFS